MPAAAPRWPVLLHPFGDAPVRAVWRGPRLWVSITAYGRAEPHDRQVGFGDHAAAAGGLVGRTPSGDTAFLADALAPPLTGLTAAATVVELLAQRGGCYVADIALARVAARSPIRAPWRAAWRGPRRRT